jgi:hypothetical protein
VNRTRGARMMERQDTIIFKHFPYRELAREHVVALGIIYPIVATVHWPPTQPIIAVAKTFSRFSFSPIACGCETCG